MNQSLRAVPLPEVVNVTDSIIIQDLGLPHGFDDERLLVNVRALERFAHAAAIGEIIISGSYGADQYDVSVASVNQAGAATAGNRAKRRPSRSDGTARVRRLVEPEDLKNEASDSGSGRMATTIATGFVINATPVSVTIRPDLRHRDDQMQHSKQAVRDPDWHAKFLQHALKSGLQDANKQANFSPLGLPAALGVHGMALVLGVEVECLINIASNFNDILSKFQFDPAAVGYALAASLLVRPALVAGVKKHMLKQTDVEMRDEANAVFKDIRQSVIMGASVDRFVLGSLALTGKRFIKSRA